MIIREKVFVGFVNEGVTQTLAGGGISIRYVSDTDPQPPETHSEAIPAPEFEIDLKPLVGGAIVPNSISFRMNGKLYADRGGVLMHSIDAATGVGTVGGSINYSTGVIKINSWEAGPLSFHMTSGLINPGTPGQSVISGRSAARPLKPSSLFVSAVSLEGGTITATAASDGSLVGPGVDGVVDIESGIYQVSFGEWVPDPVDINAPDIWRPILVDPATLRYNAVAYTYLPLDADVIGIDPVRLPSDGRVPIFRVGDVAQIMHTATTTGTPALTGGVYTMSLGRTRIAWVKVVDANGAIVTGYTLDRDLGVLTFPSISGIATPLTVRHTVSDLRQVTDAQITGALSFSRPLTHDYPAGSIVSSCLIHGDRRARVSAVWDQQTWAGTWTDSLVGSPATATLNTIAHPITVTNEGAETERWILRFVTSTTAELIGEHVGLVWSGSYSPAGADISPINPRTIDANGQGGVPYLTIPGAANGGGWAAGNVVRINTVGAIADFWMARAIQQSDEPAGDGADGCEIYCLGNIDRP